MSNQWIRLWLDMPTDPKWRTIARVSKQPITAVICVYVHLLTAAANASERGRTESFIAEDVASALDLDTEQVEAIWQAMQGRVLDGDRLTGWERRQPLREDALSPDAKTAAQRKREQRERERVQERVTPREPYGHRVTQRDDQPCHTLSRAVTQRHAPDTDADTDSEEPAADAGARECDAPPSVISPAVQVIRAVDEAIVEAFGPERARNWPAATDAGTAKAWLEAGLTPEDCLAVVIPILQRMARAGQSPPGALRYFDRPIHESLIPQANPTRSDSHGKTRETETVQRDDPVERARQRLARYPRPGVVDSAAEDAAAVLSAAQG